ncbi:MAG: tetratricopeptide repeat protein [Synergistaceae bacterium]|nr:tetratricopeptide repeat protein [Synergistaceae bacterium]
MLSMRKNNGNKKKYMLFLFAVIAGICCVLPAFSETELETALQSALARPDDPGVQAFLARAYNKNGEYGKAASVARSALEISPGFPPGLLELAHASRFQGDHECAIEVYKSYLGTHPTSEEALAGNSESLAMLQMWEESFVSAGAIIRLFPKSHSGYGALGRTYRLAGRFEEAAGLLKQGISIKENDAEILFDLGLCSVELGDREQALECYKKLVDIDTELSRKLFEVLYP